MANEIDVTQPPQGEATTAALRANFLAIRNRLEALEAIFHYQTAWTPTVLVAGSDADITYTTQWGTVLQVGALYIVRAVMRVASYGGHSGDLSIGGFPFTFQTGDDALMLATTGTSGAPIQLLYLKPIIGTNTAELRMHSTTYDTRQTTTTLAVGAVIPLDFLFYQLP